MVLFAPTDLITPLNPTPTRMELVATENQTMIAQMVRDFGAQHIKPRMMEWDESQEFPERSIS